MGMKLLGCGHEGAGCTDYLDPKSMGLGAIILHTFGV